MSFYINDPSYNTTLENVISSLDNGSYNDVEKFKLYAMINGSSTDIGTLLNTKNRLNQDPGIFKPTGYKFMYNGIYLDVCQSLSHYSFTGGNPKVSISFGSSLTTFNVSALSAIDSVNYKTYYVTAVNGSSKTVSISVNNNSYYTLNNNNIPIKILLVGGGGSGGFSGGTLKGLDGGGGGGGGGEVRVPYINFTTPGSLSFIVHKIGNGGLFDTLTTSQQETIGGIYSYLDVSYNKANNSTSRDITTYYTGVNGGDTAILFTSGGNTGTTITAYGGGCGLDGNSHGIDSESGYTSSTGGKGGYSYDSNGNQIQGEPVTVTRGGTGGSYGGVANYEYYYPTSTDESRNNNFYHFYDNRYYGAGARGGDDKGYAFQYYGSGGYGQGYVSGTYPGAGYNGIVAISIPTIYL